MSAVPLASPTAAPRHNWVVVANSTRARVLEVADAAGTLAPLADLVHTAGRLKEAQLTVMHGDGRPGVASHLAQGPGHGDLPTRAHPHEREADRFAREVAQVVNQGVADGRCAGVTLVAAQAFLGRMRARLDVAARRAVLRTVAHDYTALDTHELVARLSEG